MIHQFRLTDPAAAHARQIKEETMIFPQRGEQDLAQEPVGLWSQFRYGAMRGAKRSKDCSLGC